MTKKTNKNIQELRKGTQSIWAGEESLFEHGLTKVPIAMGVTYGYEDIDEWEAVALGKKPGHIYGRNTNPTLEVLEEKIRVLENAEAATSFSSGMAAISNTLYALLGPGKRVVSIKDTYGGSSRLFLDFLPQWGVVVNLCETTDEEEILLAIAQGCDMVYIESPTNPTMKLVDIAKIAKAAHQVGAKVAIDNTFSSPINQVPLLLGADLVIHSATKYLGGHSDALGGLVCGSAEDIKKIFQYREIHGGTLDPFSAYLIIRGIKTLELRVQRQNDNALQIAHFLEEQQGVERVFYPGLSSHPQHSLAKRQMKGFGGVLSFSLKGGYAAVKTFLENLQYVHLAASLGSVGTLAGPPRTTSHVEMSKAQRAELGIPENLIRYAVGIENPEDLKADLQQALDKIS